MRKSPKNSEVLSVSQNVRLIFASPVLERESSSKINGRSFIKPLDKYRLKVAKSWVTGKIIVSSHSLFKSSLQISESQSVKVTSTLTLDDIVTLIMIRPMLFTFFMYITLSARCLITWVNFEKFWRIPA